MNKKITLSAGLVTLFAASGVVARTVQAEEIKMEETKSLTKNTLIRVSEQELNSSKKIFEEAQNNVELKQENVSKAKNDKLKTEEEIASINKDIDTADNSKVIIEKQNEVIKNKIAAESDALNELNLAKNNKKEAHEALSNAEKNKKNSESAHELKRVEVGKKQNELNKINDSNIRNNIATTSEKIVNIDKTLNLKDFELTETSDKILEKQNEINSYKVKVVSTDLTPEERNEKIPLGVEDYKYNKENQPFENGVAKMEPVNFNGVKIVEITATKEMEDFLKAKADYERNPFDAVTGRYKTEPLYAYKIDNAAFTKAFATLLNHLRELNGIDGNMKLDNEYLEYATARANEIQKSGVLSHNTQLVEPGPEVEHGVENLSGRGVHGRSENTILFNKIETHETLAYKHLLAWYADFYNIHHYSYGHRRALFVPQAGNFGIAISTLSNDNNKNYYVSYNAKNNIGSEFKMDDSLGTPMLFVTKASPSYIRSNEVAKGFDQTDKLHVKLFGKSMKFIEDYRFVIVKREIIDERPKMQADLDALKAQKATQEQERDILAAEKTSLTQELDVLATQLNDITTARTNAIIALNQAKSDLLTLTATVQDEADVVAQKKRELDIATTRVNDTIDRISAIQKEIDDATSKRDEAERMQNQLPQLLERLKQLKLDKKSTEKTIFAAEQELKNAKMILVEAEANHKNTKNIFEIGKMLNVYKDKLGVISATAKEPLVVNELPALDISASIPDGLNIKQNSNGIASIPKVAPTTEELLKFDINVNVPEYLALKQSSDGIVAVPKVAPVSESLPILNVSSELVSNSDLKSKTKIYKVSPKVTTEIKKSPENDIVFNNSTTNFKQTKEVNAMHIINNLEANTIVKNEVHKVDERELEKVQDKSITQKTLPKTGEKIYENKLLSVVAYGLLGIISLTTLLINRKENS